MIFNCGSLFEPVLQDLHDLLPEQDVLFVNGFVVVVMAEQPVVVFRSFFDLLQEIREPVRLVVAAAHEGDAGGSTVGDDVVHRPADRVKVSPRLGVFFIGGKLPRPPRNVVDAVSRSGLALEHREPSLKIRGVRFQNPILNIMAFGTAYGEEAAALQLEDLAAHQVQHMRANVVYFATVPLRHWISFQHVIIFMVAADEGEREGQAFQPVQRFIVAAVTKPNAPEVSGDDDCVILRHVRLFREAFRLETPEVPVIVTLSRCENYSDFYILMVSYLAFILKTSE